MQTSRQPRLESWRVITEATAGAEPLSDATVRVCAGPHRVVVNGEGPGLADALDSGLAVAVAALADLGVSVSDETRDALRRQCGRAPVGEQATSVRLHVTALHENAMLPRLTSLLGQHDIDHFSYRTAPGGRARAVVGVRGDQWQVDRVAARLGRVVGVLEVLVDPGP